MDETPRVPGYTRHEFGERIGATARLRIGAAAAVMDGERLLLTRRSDNGEWCLPGGAVEPGERPAEGLLPVAFGLRSAPYFDLPRFA
jgi:hypothetical protein